MSTSAPFPGVGDGDSPADAAIAAGDDGLLVLEPPDPCSCSSPWSGTGFILAVSPGIGCFCLGTAASDASALYLLLR